VAVKDALPLVPKHLAKRLVGGKDDKGSNQDFYRDFKYIYVDIPEPEEDFPCESFKQKSKKKSITTSQGLDTVSTIAYKSIPNSNPIFVSWGQHGWNCWGYLFFNP
jgi:hypothetical protein